MDWTGKHLMIFGCGYVGTALAEAALAAGAEVTALTRNPGRAEALRAAGVSRVVQAEILDAGWRRQVPQEADFALNCLSAGGGGITAYRQAYVEGMQAILDWAATGSRRIGTLVYTGSTGVYPQSGGEAVDENASLAGGDGRSSILAEAEGRLHRPQAGIGRWFILRLAGIYGPGRHNLLDQLRAGVETLPGTGTPRMNLAHRDDVVRAILACLAAPAGIGHEVFNVSDGSPAPKREVVRWLCAALGRPVPAFAGSLSAGRRETGPADRLIANRKLLEMTDWSPGFPTYREGYGALLREV